MSKSSTLLLITVLTLSSIILITVAPASAVVKPSTPEFTVQAVAHPYDVPATYSIDPYTGENITHPGYHVENRKIEISIKNQHYAYGENYTLYYNIRIKGHYAQNWTELYGSGSDDLPAQSNSAYTVLSFSADYPNGSQVDFQVQAIVGHYYLLIPSGPWVEYEVAEMSYWSDTQTVSIGESQTPSPSLTTPELVNIIVVVVIIAVILGIAIALPFYLKKSRK
jgi:hypothetical protein